MLFISHSTKDKKFALELHEHLLNRGYSPSQIFLDSDAESGIRAGTEWKESLHAGLKCCSALILLYSNNWRASDWCSYELGHACAMGKPIFPILIEETPIVGKASDFQAVRLCENRTDALERLWKSLCEQRLGPTDQILSLGLRPQKSQSSSEALGSPVQGKPKQIRGPVADFTGREEELTRMEDCIRHESIFIVGTQGMGGIGKTELGLALAARVADGYRDAAIMLDLKGASPRPLSTDSIITYVIRHLEPSLQAPLDRQSLHAMYWQVLAGKRGILFLDNAAGADQVRPLFPLPKGWVSIITSRNRFLIPGFRAFDLAVLTPSASCQLLLTKVPRIKESAALIAELCGGLPLALSLAAGALHRRPDWEPADYASKLSDRKRRLDLLTDGSVTIRASIDLSFGLLSTRDQRLWVMLSVFSGRFTADGAVYVWKKHIQGTTDGEDAIGRMVSDSLVLWDSTRSRYYLHDLLQDYAAEKRSELFSNSGK